MSCENDFVDLYSHQFFFKLKFSHFSSFCKFAFFATDVTSSFCKFAFFATDVT